jgi:hypothetical protein
MVNQWEGFLMIYNTDKMRCMDICSLSWGIPQKKRELENNHSLGLQFQSEHDDEPLDFLSVHQICRRCVLKSWWIKTNSGFTLGAHQHLILKNNYSTWINEKYDFW